jgi:hypothetical protein
MGHILWRFLALPLIHWLIVSLAILAVGKLAEAKRLVDEAGRAIASPVRPKMAELAFRVTRADGTAGPARVYRTYGNPLRQWAWAVKEAFTSNLTQTDKGD